jgi:hypothetical protein
VKINLVYPILCELLFFVAFVELEPENYLFPVECEQNEASATF